MRMFINVANIDFKRFSFINSTAWTAKNVLSGEFIIFKHF